MLNAIILPKDCVGKDIQLFKEEIQKYKPSIKIDNNNLNKILSKVDNEFEYNYTDRNNITKNILFFILNYYKNDDIFNPIDNSKYGGMPKDGFEFVDKSKGSRIGLGIFHCHLSNINNSVLIWYLITKK